MECGGEVFQKYGVNKKKNLLYIYIWLHVDDVLIEDQEYQEV